MTNNTYITIPEPIKFSGKYKISVWYFGGKLWLNRITDRSSKRYCDAPTESAGFIVDDFVAGEYITLYNLNGQQITYESIKVIFELLN